MKVAEIFDIHGMDTEIICAMYELLVFLDAARAGAHISTVPYKVIEQMLVHPLTGSGVESLARLGIYEEVTELTHS